MDWGLGHATRSIPIIRELHHQGVEVIIASAGRAGYLLQEEFPNCLYLDLPSYKIVYQSKNMFWNIAWQFPKLVNAIIKEHYRLKKIIKAYHIEGVVSDSRFGCFNRQVACVIVTHQINIRIPFSPLQLLVNKINHWIIYQFDACWIPDLRGEGALSGTLSYPNTGVPAKYIGILSRMEQLDLVKKYDVTIVLSGPEPQRSLFEKKLIEQAKGLLLQFLIIQGKTEKKERFKPAPHIEVISFLTSKELNSVLAESTTIISRSGYSTIMDLAKLGKNAILISTPGQTEQEYLAEYLFKKGVFYTQKQHKLDLKEALKEVERFTGFSPENYQENTLRKVISDWLISY